MHFYMNKCIVLRGIPLCIYCWIVVVCSSLHWHYTCMHVDIHVQYVHTKHECNVIPLAWTVFVIICIIVHVGLHRVASDIDNLKYL